EVPEEWNTELPVILAPEIESRPGRVRVDLKLGPKTQRIPVKVRDFALDLPKDINLSIKTKLVTLEIEGPVFLFRDDDFRKKISIQVQVKEKLEPGKRQVPFTVSLPENCTLFSSSPETLTAIVKEK
ncbi:MAG: hypothetical protein KKB70_04410, partial [Proteobacteria bacterium]|nr:hypothetical protein [Pseudomonadota bacterium]